MRKSHILQIIFAISFCHCITAASASQDNLQEHITTDSELLFTDLAGLAGLQNRMVMDIDFDDDGIAWLATSGGLIQYDGRQAENARINSSSESVFVQSVMFEGGTVYFGTNTFAGFVKQNKLAVLDAGHRGISRIVQTQDGILFCLAGQDGGLLQFNNNKLQPVALDNKWPLQIHDAIQLKSKNLLFASNMGLFEMDSHGVLRNLIQHPVKDQSISAFHAVAENKHGIFAINEKGNLIRIQNGRSEMLNKPVNFECMALNPQNELMAVGVTDANKATVYQWKENSMHPVSAAWPLRENQSIVRIKVAPDGALWMVGNELALRWHPYSSEWNEFQSLPKPQFMDRENRIWFFDEEQSICFDAQKRSFERDLNYTFNPNSILAVNQEGVVFSFFHDEVKQKTDITHIADYTFDRYQNLVVCGYDSLGNPITAKYDGDWNVEHLAPIKGREIYRIAFDHANRMWFLLRSAEGEKTSFSIAYMQEGDLHEFETSIVRDWHSPVEFFIEKNNQAWILELVNGIKRFDSNTNEHWLFDRDKMASRTAIEGELDSFNGLRHFIGYTKLNDGLWFSVNNERENDSRIFHYKSEEAQQSYPAKLSRRPYVTQLNDETVLINGKSGFYLINPHTNHEPFFVKLPMKGDIASAVQEPDGAIWLGIDNPIRGKTVLRYQPDRIPPQTVIDPCENDLYPDETISFQFSGTELYKARSESMRYSWRIDDGAWSRFDPTARLSFNHADFNSGSHVFEARARDAAFEIDPSPASIEFVVHAVPIQNRVWFFPAVLATFLTIALLSFVLFLSRLRLRRYAHALEGTVEHRTQELQTTQSHLLDISEREQTRIGHELHDTVIQDLTAATYAGELQLLEMESDDKKNAVRDMVDMIDVVIQQTRKLAKGLSPVDLNKKGLLASLKELAMNVESHHSIQCSFTHDSNMHFDHPQIATNVFRIAQEAIQNAVKHSETGRIVISLNQTKNSIWLRIQDYGIGFDSAKTAQQGMGIFIMEYRAKSIQANLKIQSQPGEGSVVICQIPV